MKLSTRAAAGILCGEATATDDLVGAEVRSCGADLLVICRFGQRRPLGNLTSRMLFVGQVRAAALVRSAAGGVTTMP